MTNNLLKSLLLALPLTLLTSGVAQAQTQTVTLKRGDLQQAEFPIARRRIQIIDESPIVTDLRRAPQQDIYNVEIGPGPSAQAPRVFSIKSSGPGSLPFAGTTSNIPPGGMRGPVNLTPAKMGVMPQHKAPRAIGGTAPVLNTAKATAAKIAAAAEYPKGPDRSLLHGDAGGGSAAHATITGKLLGHQ